jgi:F-type H+-transporting ATPase subunit epsilon
MKLVISTPLQIVAEIDGVASLRAEDETGAFGIRPGHADFLTALKTSVIAWRMVDGGEGHCALHGGILTVLKGDTVSVATPAAVVGKDLSRLEAVVIQALSEAGAAERTASAQAEMMRVEAIRRIVGLLRPDANQLGELDL